MRDTLPTAHARTKRTATAPRTVEGLGAVAAGLVQDRVEEAQRRQAGSGARVVEEGHHAGEDGRARARAINGHELTAQGAHQVYNAVQW